MKISTRLRLLAATVMLFSTMGSLQAATIIDFGASWKYFVGTMEASTPVDAWRFDSFSDAAWPSGTAPIGYPSSGATGLEGAIPTMVPVGTLSVFCRNSFVVANPAGQTPLTLTVRHDDGFVAWLNGTEIGRFNVGAAGSPVAFNTPATDHEVSVSEAVIELASLQPGILVAGVNRLAIQVFNTSGASTDLFIDASLSSAIDDPPLHISTDPPPSATVTTLNVINVVFSENVTGVNASDLVINNGATPITSVATNNPRDYSFHFSQPPTGAVSVAWAPAHGITDIDSNPDPFVPGAGWSYTLNPNAISAPVLISEFMADNEHSIEDNYGAHSDWLELYNPGLIDINLDGWFLTTQTNGLTQWRIPAVNLGPNKYLLIWASERNETNPAAALHTNFKISKDAGGYLALVNPQTNVVSEFISYPAQVTDNSYGRDRVDQNLVGYFTVPSGGAQNTMNGPGYAQEPVLSLESGVYTNASLSLNITIPPGSTVVYTLNGTLPTNGSPVYSAPLALANNVTVKVRTLKAGLWPSAVQARTFIFLDATTRDFNSNLPILILSSEGRNIPENVLPGGARAKGTFAVFDTFRGRSSFQRKPDYQGPAEFEIFGQTSAGFAKKPYNVEIQDALGNDKSESILGMPAEADWKLRNPYADKCLMNDFLAYEMFEQMGHYSCRRKFVEVFVDTGGARLSYPGDYVGVEVFLEKIERGKDRVDIAELTPGDTNEPAITGGYMFKRDKPSPGADLDFNTIAGTPLKIHEPKPREVNNNINHPQVQWLRRYFSAFETAMNAANWTNAVGTNHYSHYIDVDTFVDSHWIVEFPKQIDGYRISNFFSKDRNGKVKNVPIWDWNLSFGNADYLDGGNTNQWYYTQIGGNFSGDHLWLRRLVGAGALPNSGGDPDFIQKIIDRWGTLRTNIMNGDRVVARIDQIATLLTESAARNFTKYVYLNTYQWPNPQGPPAFFVDYTQPTYELIISEMKKWTKGRYLWVDSQFLKAPILSLSAGNVTAGSTVFMTAPVGTIYYTTDGSDPRLEKSIGAIAPGALTYGAPITINGNARVFARARSGTVWSPPTIATYVVQTPRLVVSELMYHPQIALSGTNAEEFEYIELKNVGTSAIPLGGYFLSGGIDFTFPNSTLNPGQRVVVVANTNAFTARYPGVNFAGQYTGRLDNAGDHIVLKGRYHEPILDFNYENNWYPITDGFGFSLVINDDNAGASDWSLKTQWRPSGSLNGTPGSAETTLSLPRIVVNEALTHSVPPAVDIIELRNLESTNVNLGGWYLTDDRGNPKKFRIPNNTVINGNGYLQINETAFNDTNNPPNIAFALSSLGDELFLYSADLGGNLSGYVHGFDYGAQRSDVSFGRHVIGTGEEHFVAQTSTSLGSANAGPLIGPIVISEVMYRPPSVYTNGAYWNNFEDEFIELRNISGATVNLFDTTNSWKLDQAVEFSFPMGTSLASGATLLVVNFNPVLEASQLAAFRSKYGISPTIAIYGPYQGDLANADERVTLYRPDAPVAIGPDMGMVGYVVVDRVHYFDSAPWPTSPDGLGHSLQRINVSAYGNDPANWTSGAPTAGAGYVSGTGPTITMNPVSQVVVASTTANLSGLATGPGPLTYRWLFNGNVIDGASNSVLTIPNVQFSHAGSYQMVALNPFGSAASTLATLSILTPPTIVQQPTNVLVRVKPDPIAADKTNATFTVFATTMNPPLSYRWRFYGTNLLEAANITGIYTNTLVISNVTIASGGDYSCAVTDSSGTIVTTNATLYPLVLPIIVPGSISYVAVTGAPVTLSVAMPVGNPLPYTVEWRRGSTSLATNIVYEPADFITVIAPTPATANQLYRVLVRNLATATSPGGASQGIVATNFITSYVDSDLDGVPDPFDSNPGANDANLDSDEDGVSNYKEYVAGTDPNSNQSYLKVDNITATGDTQLEFIAVSNRTYSVLYKNSLTAGSWLNLSDVAARPTNRVERVVDSSPGTNRFYRLVTPKQ